MADWQSHDVAYRESFAIRRPVLEAMKGLKDRWRLSVDGTRLEVDLPLTSYTPHERAVIEFALDPHYTRENIFHGLDVAVRHALAKAVYEFFGQGGPADGSTA